MLDKSYTYLLNIVLKTCNTEFDDIIIFMDQNGRPLEIEGKVNLRLHTNK